MLSFGILIYFEVGTPLMTVKTSITVAEIDVWIYSTQDFRLLLPIWCSEIARQVSVLKYWMSASVTSAVPKASFF